MYGAKKKVDVFMQLILQWGECAFLQESEDLNERQGVLIPSCSHSATPEVQRRVEADES